MVYDFAAWPATMKRGPSRAEIMSSTSQTFPALYATFMISTAFFYRLVVFSNAERLEINPLTPNDHCRSRTAPLTSKVAFYVFIQQI